MPRRAALLARAFGLADLARAAIVALGVFVGLPSRWAPVDAVAVVLVAVDLAAGIGLLASAPWASRVARIGSSIALAAGLSLITALAVTASWLSGVYGTVGLGGAVLMLLVAALALPYLVVLPVVQLVWLRGPRP
jgi:hypothetical protein